MVCELYFDKRWKGKTTRYELWVCLDLCCICLSYVNPPFSVSVHPKRHLIFFFLTFYFVLGYSQLTNDVIVSGEEWRDSAICIHVFILRHTPLPSRLLHSMEQNSMCSTVVPCWLSILNMAVCTRPFKLPDYSFPWPFPSATVSLFSKSVSLFLFHKFICIISF